MGNPGAIEDIRPFAELAQNATTVVYKAYQSSLERFVLLKRLRGEYSSDEDLSARFQEEARIAARVQHRNVVSVYSFGSDAEGAYIVAEFVEGLDLGELVERGKIPPDLAVYILLEAAKGLKAAHDKAVLHRDLKPSNILISHDGEVKLTDFGLASVSGSADESPSEIRGTLSFLAPEQILGESIDHRCDLFSLGATFFEMLTARRAFPGSDSKEILDAVMNRDAHKFLRATPGVTPQLEAIGSKLLARNPDDRFANVDELIAALEDYRSSRPEKAGRKKLRAFIDDPEAFAAAAFQQVDGHSIEPEIAVVPDGRSAASREDELARTQRARAARVTRATAVAAAVLFFAAAAVFAGVEILGRSSTAIGPRVEREFGRGAFASDSLGFVTGFLPVDTLLARIDSAAAAAADAERPRRRERPRPQRSESKEDAPGVLALRVLPWASVHVNGDSLGTSREAQPLYVEMSPGKHEVTLTNPEFPRVPREFLVAPGDTTTATVSLWSQVARLDLNVSPWADVYVDGEYKGQTPLSEPVVLLPGVRRLRLVNPELPDGTREYSLTVAKGDTLTREYILTDIP